MTWVLPSTSQNCHPLSWFMTMPMIANHITCYATPQRGEGEYQIGIGCESTLAKPYVR